MRGLLYTLTLALVFLFYTEVAFPAKSLKLDRRHSLVLGKIKQDLSALNSLAFGSLLSRWKNEYGKEAVIPLMHIAHNRSTEDNRRYIALMGIARLGDSSISQMILPLLKDRSWMIRNGALRALRVLGDRRNPSLGKEILALLKDPALVVRSEVIFMIQHLRPQGSVAALTSTLKQKNLNPTFRKQVSQTLEMIKGN